MNKLLISFAALVAAGMIYASTRSSHLAISRDAQALAFTENIDISKYKNFSLQANYNDTAAVSAFTVTDGVKSTSIITVSPSVAAHLVSAQASVYCNVASTTSLSGKYITINGVVFTAGSITQNRTFAVGASTTATAVNLALIVAAHPDFDATSSGSTVTIKAASKGTYANSYTSTSSGVMVMSAATFSGGLDVHTINIGGVTLTEGTDFTATSNNTNTAKAIAAAINAHATLSTLYVSTNIAAVVYSTAIAGGTAYNTSINSSTSAYAITGSGFSGGTASDIADSIFTESAHGLGTGWGMKYATTAGTAPQNLITQTTYYAIVIDPNRFKLASSTTTAAAGTAITVSTFTGSGTFTFTPRSFATGAVGGSIGAPSFKFQASNDNTNWNDVQSTISSFTYTADGYGIRAVSEAYFPYKYLRINFVAPSQGALDLDVYVAGSED